jgi:amino acid adenylation domain-containing protein/non-ribosomal peptide synthase protein (TIGR01720 family)
MLKMPAQCLEGFRLSPQQRHVWKLLQRDGDSCYRCRCVISVKGGLDSDLLTQAVRLVCARHEVLRTRFRVLPGLDMPLQVISSDTDFVYRFRDMAVLPDSVREFGQVAELSDGSELGDSESCDVPLRVTQLSCSPERHFLVLDLPAMCADAASLDLLSREVHQAYLCLSKGGPMGEPQVQYADISETLNNCLESEEFDFGRQFWRERIAERTIVPLPLGLPGERFSPQAVRVPFADSLSTMVDDLCARYGIGREGLLLGCWGILVCRLAAADVVLLGLCCDGRPHELLRDAIGPLSVCLPFPFRIAQTDLVENVLRSVDLLREEFADQQHYFDPASEYHSSDGEYQECTASFEFLRLLPERALDSPAFAIDCVSAFLDRFAIKLRVTDEAGLLRCHLEYDTCRLTEGDAGRIASCLVTLLDSIWAKPGLRISQLEMTGVQDKVEVVAGCEAQAEVTSSKCIHELIQDQCQQRSDAVAVVFEDLRISYAELDRRANHLGQLLHGLGIGPEVCVGVCVERGAEMVTALLAVLKAGGAYIPLDPSFPTDRIAYMLDQAQAPLLITQSSLLSLIPKGHGVICFDRDQDLISQCPDVIPGSDVVPGNLAYVIYTSGSTGKPKAVAIEHRQLTNYVAGISRRLGPEPGWRMAFLTTIAADLGLTVLYPSLCAGGELHILSEDRGRDPKLWEEYCTQKGMDFVKMTPSHLVLLADRPTAFPLRALVLGGEPWSQETLTWLDRRGPRCKVVNHYGPTECTVGALTHEFEDGEPGNVPIGAPIANTRGYAMDGRGDLMLVNAPGELYIGGMGVARGYLNEPGLTAERFVPSGFNEQGGVRLYRTGDMVVRRANGELEYLRRIDNQVKVRGYRIELSEIEAVLSGHEAVKRSAVLLREDEPGAKQLVAYAVLADPQPSSRELREYLLSKLPEYMVPPMFVFLPDLPLTANGKLDRKNLPRPAAAQVSRDKDLLPSLVEDLVAGIFAEVLRVERPGIHQNFFELGGHSLLATQVLSRIRDVLGVEVPLRCVFDSPTPAGLAAVVGHYRRAERRFEAPPIRRASRDVDLPLSFAQQRLWFIQQLEPESGVYNMPYVIRLRGPLEIAHLRRSLSDVASRHEVLRTRFVSKRGQAIQMIDAPAEVQLPLWDLSGLPDQVRESKAREIAGREGRQPFDLEHGPLYRAALFRLGQQDHILFLCLHHIVSDAWSTNILTREFVAYYTALQEGREAGLPELPVQYADYAVWQREWLQGEVLEEQLAFWRRQLMGAPQLELPADRPRPVAPARRAATISLSLSPEQTRGANKLAQREAATLFMTLLAAFQLVLARIAGQEDIIVGTDAANRNRLDTEGVIGFFVNQLVLRTDLSGNPSLRALLARARETTLEAYEHQDLPFEKLVEELAPERDLNRQPFFQVKFALKNAARESYSLPGIWLQPFGSDSRQAKWDFTLFAIDGKEATTLTAEYMEELYEASSVERVLRQVTIALEAMTEDMNNRIGAVELLTASERRMICEEWNPEVTARDERQCIQELFQRRVEQTPDSIAVVCDECAVSYSSLNAASNRLAWRLIELDVDCEARVALCLEREPLVLVAMLAVLKAGGAYVPLDPNHPGERLQYVVKDSQASIVITQSHLLSRMSGMGVQCIELDRHRQDFEDYPADNPRRQVVNDNLAYIIYTSGSTGRPKGVMITHRGLTNYVEWAADAYRVRDCSGSVVHSSIGFDLTITGLFVPLLGGGAVKLVSEMDSIEALSKVAGIGDTASLVKLTPGQLNVLRREPVSQGRTAFAGILVIGGEALIWEDLEYWRRRQPGVRLINEYGPTETVVGCCVYEVPPEGKRQGAVPIGRAIANAQAYVLDKWGQLAAPGLPGELWIGGAGVARGYCNQPGLTAERFAPDDFSARAAARLYQSGDQAKWTQGELEYLGRLDGQIKLRGYRVELGEIESVLAQCPSVRQCVVCLRQDEPGLQRLVAYYVAVPTKIPAEADLRSYISARLPEYMIPSAFVRLEQMPLTENGKVDRRSLPKPESKAADAIWEAPRNRVEEVLAEIWTNLLGVQNVGVNDNFFALGGDSILSIQVVARAREEGIYLTPRQFFEHQTIAGLAEVAGIPHLANEQETLFGPVALTPIQRAFFDWPFTNPHHYNQSAMLELKADVDSALLERALLTVIHHHDALRLQFERSGDDWSQSYGQAPDRAPFDRLDLSALPNAERLAALRSDPVRVQKSLDLLRGQLLRAVEYKLAGGRRLLLLVIHHLVVDGVSWRILLEDLERVYRQLVLGESPQLPPKTTSYRRWAERLQEYGRSAAAQPEAAYWLSGEWESGSAGLPGDEKLGENTLESARTVSVWLSPEETQALLQRVPSVYHTQINDVLLTSVMQTLVQATGGQSFLVELEGHGREDIFEDIDVSRTVGWFTSLFPVLLRLDTAEPGAALKQIKEQVRKIPSRGLLYAVLKYLGVEGEQSRRLGTVPRPQIRFNYLGQFDQVFWESSLFNPVREDSGPNQAIDDQRPYLLDVTAMIANSCLRIDWTYSENIHRRATIEQLAGRFVESLSGLITHCLLPEAGGYTPSDFPLAALTQDKLDVVIAQLGQSLGRNRVESIYPLSPMQQGLLLHSLFNPNSTTYFIQNSCRIQNGLDVSAFRRAWESVLQRHSILRTCFIWEGLDEPLQVVHRRVELPWREEDWRESPPPEWLARLQDYLDVDRRQGFDFSNAPSMRFALFRTRDDTYHFVWSSHHVLVDAWCNQLIIKEVFRAYDAFTHDREPEGERARPYLDYIAWLGRQSVEEAEAFWREELRGFTGPTRLGLHNGGSAPPSDAQKKETVARIDRLATGRLEMLAKQFEVTLNTIVQAAWAVALSLHTGRSDVLFGTVVSGRSAPIPGIDAMVGVFINTLPVRVRLSAQDSVKSLLKGLHLKLANTLAYEYSPLVRLQAWSELPVGTPLFESLFQFQNFPVDGAIREQAGTALRISEVRNTSEFHYPITILVGPGAELRLRMVYDTARFDASGAAQVFSHFRVALESLASDADLSVNGLIDAVRMSDDTELVRRRNRVKEGRRRRPDKSETKSVTRLSLNEGAGL